MAQTRTVYDLQDAEVVERDRRINEKGEVLYRGLYLGHVASIPWLVSVSRKADHGNSPPTIYDLAIDEWLETTERTHVKALLMNSFPNDTADGFPCTYAVILYHPSSSKVADHRMIVSNSVINSMIRDHPQEGLCQWQIRGPVLIIKLVHGVVHDMEERDLALVEMLMVCMTNKWLKKVSR